MMLVFCNLLFRYCSSCVLKRRWSLYMAQSNDDRSQYHCWPTVGRQSRRDGHYKPPDWWCLSSQICFIQLLLTWHASQGCWSFVLLLLLFGLLLWRCWLGGRKGIRPVKMWGTGVVICLERGADLHMAQLMPLPLTLSCSSKIQIAFTFLVLAYPGCPRKEAVKWLL